MTYEPTSCSRCTRKCYCIVFDDLKFCNACFDTAMNDPETKALMGKLLKQYGKA